jgi:hypothetical protein
MQFYLQSRSVFFWLGSDRSASGFSAYPVNRLTARPCSPSCGFDTSMSKPESRLCQSRKVVALVQSVGIAGGKSLKFHSTKRRRKIVCFIQPQAYLQDSVERCCASALTVINGPGPAFLSDVIGGGKQPKADMPAGLIQINAVRSPGLKFQFRSQTASFSISSSKQIFWEGCHATLHLAWSFHFRCRQGHGR